MQKKYFNLTEMLIVIAIMLVMFEAAFEFFYDGSKLCTQAIENSFNNQEMFILAGKFRNAVHQSSDWEKNENCLIAGQKKMVAEKNRLFLLVPNGKTELALLPENAQLSLDVEKNGSSAKLAVLNIRIKGKKNIKDRVRIVSCMQ